MTEGTPTVLDRVRRAANDRLFSMDELDALGSLVREISEYIGRATGRQLEGGIEVGIDHILRHKALPMLSARPKAILARVDGEAPTRSHFDREGCDPPQWHGPTGE